MSHCNLGYYGYTYWFHLFGILYRSIYDYARLKIFLKKQLKMYVSQQVHATLVIVINSISIFCASVELVNSVLGLLRELLRVTDCVRSGCKHSMSFKSVNMQNKHGGLIWLYDCYLKRCVKNSLTQYSFSVMESRVSSNCTYKNHRFIGKDYQKVADLKVYACSDTDLGKVLFHYIMFCNKENRDLLRKIYRISFNEIS